jgi:hypothetical protein
LWIADPKAIHHILQAACYQYQKPPHRRARSEMLVDRGLFWAEGELALAFHSIKTSNCLLRRRAQTTKEGNDPRIWSR